MDERTRLLALVAAGRAAGRPDDELMRRYRLRRDAYRALVDELATTPGPQPDDPAARLPLCACENTGTLPTGLLEEARWAAGLRPPAQWQIDQVHTTPADLARRASFLLEQGDVQGKDVLFVGDDDFCSLLVARVGKPRRVVVVDIDERILATLAAQAKAHGLPLETVRYDLSRLVTEPAPPELTGRFDTFITDPPYSDAGMMLFCAFGMTALRRRSGAVGCVATPWLVREEWSDELLFRLQQAFVGEGFVLSDVRRAFSAYEHEDNVFATFFRAVSFLPDREPRHLLARYEERKLYSARRWVVEEDT